jgi:CheY-like chemotaxis protein/CHASE3 domain sensor protein
MDEGPDAPAASRRRLRSLLPPATLGGFIAATLAVLLIAVLSYQSHHSRTIAANRVTHTLEVTRQIETLLSTLKDAETGQRGYLITGMERYLGPYETAVASLPRQLARARVLLRDAPAQLQRLDVVERLIQIQLAELKQTIALRRAGQIEAALAAVSEDRGRLSMEQLRATLGDMSDSERTLFDQRTQEWISSASFSVWIVWGGSAVLLFLIGVAALLSARDLQTQRTQSWLQTAQSQLGLRMQGEQSMDGLSDNVVSFLATYLDAKIGVLYKMENADHLQLHGSYALPKALPNAPAPSGLTMQAFKQNSLLFIRDVPADYFQVTSSLGGSRPRHVVIAPTQVDGAANGVIELGFFRAVGAPDLELLRRVAEPIGSALRSCKYRERLRNLLEESQRQAEELQTQQEELRVQNEELEQQSRALQESKGRLQNQQAELEQINAHLEEQTQTLERQRDDLARAQGELQRVNAYKSEFLANMSHELRTPLNSSLILAKLLADNPQGNLSAEQVKFAQTIYSAGNDLLTLINDILDLSKIEAGKLDVRPEDVTVSRLVDELLNTFQPIARDKQIEFTISLDPEAPKSIYTDSVRLLQIIRNLLSNALKFTERGSVQLLVRRAPGDRVAFAVKDTGIGIAPSQHEIIFEAFRQADGTTNRKFGGTGLGLSISRDLARLLGGDLTVESAPGEGSVFTLVVPLRCPIVETRGPRESRRLPPIEPRRPASATSPPNPSPPSDPSDPPNPAGEGAAEDDRDRLTVGARAILVIEDDLKFAHILRDLARELDFKVLLAHSAAEGLALANRYRPSAIVLDIGLPDRSGLTVLDALKHSSATRHIPVHVVSASDYTQTALEMGAAGYAIKPVRREELIEAFKRLEARFTQKLRRVLVVEDDDVQRDSTCRLLAAQDVETVAAGTAAEALQLLSEQTFDCMVLDLKLPDRNGIELLQELAHKDLYSFPPIIVYTGRSLTREEEQQLRRFSSSIIIKGARSPERLLDEVSLFLHQVESDLPPDKQRMIRDARGREAVFEGRRVLVVEDDVRNIFALSKVLEPKGAKVEIARNGREALAHIKAKPGVDLVLMDIMMPEMDGLQATREIRKMPEGAKIPIIALTAKAMADDREQCMAAGANDYIAKPLDIDKLLSLARVWMPK